MDYFDLLLLLCAAVLYCQFEEIEYSSGTFTCALSVLLSLLTLGVLNQGVVDSAFDRLCVYALLFKASESRVCNNLQFPVYSTRLRTANMATGRQLG